MVCEVLTGATVVCVRDFIFSLASYRVTCLFSFETEAHELQAGSLVSYADLELSI